MKKPWLASLFLSCAIICLRDFVANAEWVNAYSGFIERDCTAKERLQCEVFDSCDRLGFFVRQNSSISTVPDKPGGLRVDYYIVSHVHDQDGVEPYTLNVNVSWEPPRSPRIFFVEGFEVRILKESGREVCFLLLLTNSSDGWIDKDRSYSVPRFSLRTSSVFEFGRHYHVEVTSLPKLSPQADQGYGGGGVVEMQQSGFAVKQVQMPPHPDESLPEGAYNCSSRVKSHPHAHSWLAAFRGVHTYPYAQELFVEFVAAPIQYCFQRYQIRLESGNPILGDVVQRAWIYTADLVYENLGNHSCGYGNHTFTGVTPGLYHVGVVADRYRSVPAEATVDGRGGDVCVCKDESVNLCGCTVAVYPDIRMNAVSDIESKDLVTVPRIHGHHGDKGANGTDMSGSPDSRSSRDDLLIVMIIIFLIVLALLIFFCVLVLWRRYNNKKKGVVMYIANGGTSSGLPTSMETLPLSSKTTTFDQLAGVDRPHLRVLLVYAHDCAQHEAVVEAFADFLEEQLEVIVRLDSRCPEAVAENKYDWAYGELAAADRIVIVNSVGAWARYHGKLGKGQGVPEEERYAVERVEPGPLDDLFVCQFDLLLDQHYTGGSGSAASRHLTIYFDYTPLRYLLSGRLLLGQHRYEMMKHIDRFGVALFGPGCEHVASIGGASGLLNDRDYRLSPAGAKLHEALDQMVRFQINSPDWFEQSHVKRSLNNCFNGTAHPTPPLVQPPLLAPRARPWSPLAPEHSPLLLPPPPSALARLAQPELEEEEEVAQSEAIASWDPLKSGQPSPTADSGLDSMPPTASPLVTEHSTSRPFKSHHIPISEPHDVDSGMVDSSSYPLTCNGHTASGSVGEGSPLKKRVASLGYAQDPLANHQLLIDRQ